MNTIPAAASSWSLFLIFLLLPIYWLINMSFKTNNEIITDLTLWPHEPTLDELRQRSSPTRAGIPATSIR